MPATKRKFAAPVGILINSVSTVESSVASTGINSGSFVISGGLGVGSTSNFGRNINLWNSASTFYTGIKAGNSTVNTIYTLPINYPGTGTSVLQSDTSGTLTWVPMTASGGGSGTTSANINIVSAGTNASHPVLFTPSSSSSGSAVSSNSTLVYNPSTDILSVAGLAVTAATSSSSTSTGALVVTGGVGIGDSLNVAGNVSINSGTNGLVFRKLVSGNYGAIYSTNITPSATNYTMITDGASVNFNGTNGVYFNVSNTNKIQVTANNINIVPSVDSISTSTGAFTVAGGVGIGGSLYVGGQNRFSGARNSTSTTSGTLVIDGGLGITGNAFIGSSLNVVGQTLITSSLGSTNNTTGALVVTGGVGISGQLSFVSASLGFTGITYNPSMAFIGNTSSSPIFLTVLTDNSLAFEGSSGQLFSIDNNLSTGEIFSVNDISGLPVISASAGQTVSINEFGGFTRIGNGTISSTSGSNTSATGSLVVYGGVGITGNANIGGTVRINSAINSNTSQSGSLVVIGGLGVTGNVAIGGTVIRSSYAVGETIFTGMFNNTDLSMQATTTVSSTSFVPVTSLTYTPKSSSSYLWIEFNANFDFNDGSTVDDFWSNITVNGTEIAAINQRFINASGGGSRSGTIFPIFARYTNSTTSGIAISVNAKRGTADDNIRIYGSSTSGYMRIQEIGR